MGNGEMGKGKNPDPDGFERVAIVGFGLIGGSLALALRRRAGSVRILAVDRDDVVRRAMRTRAADEGSADPAVVAGADLIVLAAPIRQNIDLLQRLPDMHPGSAIVTDVGSTKEATAAAAAALPPRLPFVGGHPLAGAAVGGLDAARPDLFENRPWILCPAATARPADVERLERLLSAVGARVARMTSGEHDRLVAFLSQLPQLVASALMQVVGAHTGAAGLALAGRGLRDTTRLATSPADIWRDIAATNAGPLRAALDEMIEALLRLRENLGDDGAIDEVFAAAARWKQVLEEGHSAHRA
ncbi:MAG TPA: prephenate dehydrogenase/arogenate dehydrogenase family protein [Vicinamibacterales bacterium]|nr:prephenate dehydrogenase/arogenate dehydrogenase family protein [Vicinamibacterales bacterium]